MKAIPSLLPLLFLAISPLPSFGQWKPVTGAKPETISKNYPELVEACRKVMASQYMAKNPKKPTVAAPPGWGAVWQDPRMIECDYTTAGKKGARNGKVILFNPSAELLATWIVNAVIETSGKEQTYSAELGNGLLGYIKSQSGAQFPVVGVVWEDLVGSDGVPEAYPFLDGITMKNSPAAYYQDGKKSLGRNTALLEDAALKASLSLRWKPGEPGRYARISSTTKEMIADLYQKMGIPCPPEVEKDYPAYVRTQYITAMNGTRNELLVAKLWHYIERHRTGAIHSW